MQRATLRKDDKAWHSACMSARFAI